MKILIDEKQNDKSRKDRNIKKKKRDRPLQKVNVT